jgi:hypothetical protein
MVMGELMTVTLVIILLASGILALYSLEARATAIDAQVTYDAIVANKEPTLMLNEISELTGMSIRRTEKAVDQLVEHGWLKRSINAPFHKEDYHYFCGDILYYLPGR